MCTPKLSRDVPALVVAAVLLVAAPALAAPSPPASVDSTPAPGALQLLAGWWAGLTAPVTALFAPARAEIDPDGGSITYDPDGPGTGGLDGGTYTATSTDGPTEGTESRAEIDPDG